MIIESAVVKASFFNVELFSDCRLIRLLCHFIALFIVGGLIIGFFISDDFNSMIIRMVISYVSVCTILCIDYLELLDKIDG